MIPSGNKIGEVRVGAIGQEHTKQRQVASLSGKVKRSVATIVALIDIVLPSIHEPKAHVLMRANRSEV